MGNPLDKYLVYLSRELKMPVTHFLQLDSDELVWQMAYDFISDEGFQKDYELERQRDLCDSERAKLVQEAFNFTKD